MKLYQSMFVALVVISVIGDVSHFFHNVGASPGSEVSRNSYSLILGSDASSAPILRAFATAARSAGKTKPKGGHTKNKRPSTKSKHEKGDARRQRDQERSRNLNRRGGGGRG